VVGVNHDQHDGLAALLKDPGELAGELGVIDARDQRGLVAAGQVTLCKPLGLRSYLFD
jgi:hypothetical protein